MKKVKKTIWEYFVAYPSFNIRFWSVFLIGFIAFVVLTKYGLQLSSIDGFVENQIAILNLMVQSATLILGIFATYYALRQLVETRFATLDQSAMQELQRKRYSRAFDKWREAFHIRPEASVFTNLSETLLLIGDYDMFDRYIRLPYSPTFFQTNILEEDTDKIIVLYLKAVRHLLVKNQGEAEKYIGELIKLVKQAEEPKIEWSFVDLQSSITYQDLAGECKLILDNLILYLQKSLIPIRKKDFESALFATQKNEAVVQSTVVGM